MSGDPGTEDRTPPRPLFEPSPHPRMSAFDLLCFLVSAALVFGGFYVMSLAFTYEEWGFWLFFGGVLLDALGLWMAFGLIPNWRAKRGDRA